MRRAENRQFLSQKNLAMARLLSEIDSPQDDSLSSNPTPPLLSFPQQQILANQPPDSLQHLLNKAQEAMRSASQKTLKQLPALKAQKQLQQAGKEDDEAFLTGVLLEEPPPKEIPNDPPSELLDEEVMKLLRKKTLDDELLELKRQIKLTNGQLKSYERQVKDTQKSVYSLANRYNSYFNLNVPVKTPTVDFSGLSYFQLKNFKNCLRKQE